MQKIIIEGREFVPIKNGTFAHDIWLMQRVRAAGLSQIRIADNETEDAFIERIAAAAWESGSVLELLGGSLIPANVPAVNWSPELAEECAAFFGAVTDEESKKQLRMQIGGILFYFFINGLSASKTSPKYGAKTYPEGEPQENAGLSTMATGAT